MLKLRQVRERLGVCLQMAVSLLVPGTGSAGVRGCSDELPEGTAVEEVCWCREPAAAFVTHIKDYVSSLDAGKK